MHQVWVTYTSGPNGGDGTWTSTRPRPVRRAAAAGVRDDQRFAHLEGLPDHHATQQFVVQAANGLGLVAFDDNRGSYYRAVAAGAPVALADTSLSLVTPPTSGVFGDTKSITVELKSGGSPLAGKAVTVLVAGSGAVRVTGSDGRVTVPVAINAVPGATTITASFGGDSAYAPSEASAPFTIAKAPSALAALTPFVATTSTTSTGVMTTLSATIGGKQQPLIHTTVSVTLTGPVTRTLSVITNYLGQVTLPVGLTAGAYSATVTFAGNETYLGISRAGTIVVAPFTGFFSPVDNLPTLNAANAGQSIPVKFSLGGDRGLAILATGYPLPVKIACASGLPTDAIEETNTANSSLTYDPTTNQYKYNWKTVKAYAGLCYRLDFKFVDGTTVSASFKFK